MPPDDLYELGDLDRTEYLARRQEIQALLAELAPEPLPDLDEAEQVLNDVSLVWRDQSDPETKRHMLKLVFERKSVILRSRADFSHPTRLL